ncbi:AAA family ATPase [Ramlibacter humi]|uniref:AAA family ATPase n=1 Tax=Ramlibacter humi TaxID=2530451 RepID=A0A4Z0C9A8_9BURK|nr:AAA family ATPase [Ramlibacter humi]TFZ07911.1 AAA family ATPase [Ramlibacter humi]
MEPQQEQLKDRIARRSAHLRQVACELKQELYGIDAAIDRVIESVRAWYVLPEIVQRPVIVCLWGLTGTGKTQLVRQLTRKLGFYDRFVEVQMDGFSHGSGYWSNSISSMLADSGIREGERGVVLLDEFQRFRTLDEKGTDQPVRRYQDVWALLSDGRLPPPLSFLQDLEAALASAEYDEDERQADAAESKDGEKPRVRRYRLSPWEARELKQSLKLAESLTDIMAWTPSQVRERMEAFRASAERWDTDYSRLLIFVAGNLDEMYQGVAKRVEDCDTDAEIFHRYTRRLSVIDAKKALALRFKPEQVARLGNTHIVYASLDRAAYERLIAQQCQRYALETGQASGLVIEVDAGVQHQLYANGVFPAQGTRPLFSTIQSLLGGALAGIALWALEQGAEPGDAVQVSMSEDAQHLCARWRTQRQLFPASLELSRLKQRTHPDFRALLAAHEAGHALLYGLLLGHVPLEVKINVASFDGGYNSYLPLRTESRRTVLDTICVSLGGRAAETLVFGPDACTTGARQDLRSATREAAEFVRVHGFAGRLAHTDVGVDPDCDFATDVDATNAAVERILASQMTRAQQLLRANAGLLARIAQALVRDGEVSRAELAQWMGLATGEDPLVTEPYAARLQRFTQLQLRTDGEQASEDNLGSPEAETQPAVMA